jgi:hypothetical protein
VDLIDSATEMTITAFLAPEIVEAIATGHQPPELTAEALAKRIDLSLLWNEQLQATDRPMQVRSL